MDAPATLPLLFTGPVRAEHVLPGRLRFRVRSLVGQRARAATLASTLSGLTGIDSVRASPVTGSVLVAFTPGRIEPGVILYAIARLLGMGDELYQRPEAMLTREIKALLAAVNVAIHDGTRGTLDVWSLLLLVLGGVGAKKVYEDGWASWPTGVTLLWWALDVASKRRTAEPRAEGA